MGWTLDALHSVPRTLWLSHFRGVACAVGASVRAQSTAKMLLVALKEAAAERGLPDFGTSVRIGVGDVHCLEVALAYASFLPTNSREPSCTARLIPSWLFADKPEPGVLPNYTARSPIEPTTPTDRVRL